MLIALTKKNIERLPFSTFKTLYYIDRDLAGFGLRVGKKRKSFYIERPVNKKAVRVSLGTYPAISAEDARKKAIQTLALMEQGINPNLEHKKKVDAHQKSPTLQQVHDDFISQKATYRPDTLNHYQGTFRCHLKNWGPIPVTEIHAKMVLQRHNELVMATGHLNASRVLKILRSLLNFALSFYLNDDGTPLLNFQNPTFILTQTNSWASLQRRQTVIPKKDLAKWFRAILSYRSSFEDQNNRQTFADYLLFILLTGLRRGECQRLKWSYFDLENGSVTIPGEITKNHRSHFVALSDFAWDLLKERNRFKRNDYFFPCAPKPKNRGKVSYFSPKTLMLQEVNELTSVKFSLHDLRRTFASIAEALNLNAYTIKRLLNHSLTTDVTGGYISRNYDQDRLREPLQQITDFILAQANIKKGDPLAPFYGSESS